ncbi:hypothetical protein H206_05326 [Candidatus Electrothrix aarhusensis]|uniref:Uncharacterized protein n=1 Tax=Candidatus Electrothrix aarhusensis TaxID=1859131 RepID=A0A3S3UBM1_9BACT|nr:hypothetical protein H206_05326 [Candidatus Electrothrix aarhusensis]
MIIFLSLFLLEIFPPGTSAYLANFLCFLLF